MTTSGLAADLRRDEGVRRSVYQDSLGFWTLGVGRLVDGRKGGGLSDDEIDYLLANDMKRVAAGLDTHLPWWRKLDDVRQDVLANMGHQLGVGGLCGFKRTLADIERGAYQIAAEHMLDSLWARQCPERAGRLAEMMRTGKRP